MFCLSWGVVGCLPPWLSSPPLSHVGHRPSAVSFFFRFTPPHPPPPPWLTQRLVHGKRPPKVPGASMPPVPPSLTPTHVDPTWQSF